eukprot:m.72326 g.72326  ORF g.72326 m.72326 type:complete len:57 (+) comp18719_c0_seq1:384-554(+)
MRSRSFSLEYLIPPTPCAHAILSTERHAHCHTAMCTVPALSPHTVCGDSNVLHGQE